MSATFKNAKKKLSQSELRKLMNEHKGKAQRDVQKIDSPLAKYNEQGQLTCILCKSVVRSESVWTVHINAKQHKQNVELARKLKERTNNFTTPVKRPLSPPQVVEIPEKKPKGILKNANPKPVTLATKIEVVEGKNGLPNDFFDNGTSKPSINKTGPPQHEKMDTDDAQELPEGFFDDPKLDAKARHQEYKDPVEEEWDKFVRAIKEADNESAAIIAEDQEEATNERQIDEIDEQMKNLSRVLTLEKKKVEVISVTNDSKQTGNEEEEEELDDDNFDEYLDWRSKKSFI
ncbi:zinc finger protein 830 [Aethina tumida]|uniref:zinc finger protein 830 n=1 Tax=Aethina tumida TaxID=116153 RepID=UPI00096B09D9|nr:zinc finger protein 830 [Aethina tumida]